MWLGMSMWLWLGVGGLAGVGLAYGTLRAKRKAKKKIVRWGLAGLGNLLALLSILTLAGGGYAFWFSHRSQPAPLQKQLFPGVHYVRDVRQNPRPLVIHVVTIDLSTPGVHFVVTGGDSSYGHMVRAKRTTRFIADTGCQIAINGGFFKTVPGHGWTHEFPHQGDALDVVGLGASQGKVYSPASDFYETLFISKDNQLSFKTPVGPVYNAISGSTMIVEDGQSGTRDLWDFGPMTAIGLDKPHQHLILMVVDGKQPGYSDGIYPLELADLMLEYGAWEAVYFDGGGSSTLAIEGANGKPELLSLPCNLGVVGLERPVGNQLGVYVKR